jgi:plastocyanin
MKCVSKSFLILVMAIPFAFMSCSNDNDGYSDDGYIEPGDESPTELNSKTYEVTNSGASAYIFNGEGLSDSSNPNFTFKRGSTYTLNVNTLGHPFLLKSVQGTGSSNIYNAGVANNGAVSGTITFTVPADAPDTLYYNCEFHGSMTGTITITN